MQRVLLLGLVFLLLTTSASAWFQKRFHNKEKPVRNNSVTAVLPENGQRDKCTRDIKHPVKNLSLGACQSCHSARDLLFDTPAGDVAFSHQVHGSMFSCEDCHQSVFPIQRGVVKRTMLDMGNGESCGACHDDDAAFTVLDNCDVCHQM